MIPHLSCMRQVSIFGSKNIIYSGARITGLEHQVMKIFGIVTHGLIRLLISKVITTINTVEKTAINEAESTMIND